MEKAVENQFSEELLIEAARKFGLQEEGLVLLGKFENYVYEGEREGTPYILRLVHSSHRDENMVLGELDWLKFLADKGVNVAKPVPSINGRLVELISVEEDYFMVSLFEKAQGKIVDPLDENEWNETLFNNWGRTIGKIHRVTKEYKISDERYRRPEWDEDDLLALEKYLPNDEEHIVQIGRNLVEYLYTLPKDQNSYGLIHTDIHFRNFFAHNGEITVFDFDDCSYQWFVSDIAIALYYSVWWSTMGKTEEEIKNFGDRFLSAFLIGYSMENEIEEYWLEQLPHFLKLRDIVLYSVFNKKFDMANLNDRQRSLLNQIKERIEKDIPILQL